MLQNQSRIEKHKADIEKRIYELETKLRDPNNLKAYPEINNSHQRPGDSRRNDEQEHRKFVQKQQYVQPYQVTALRERSKHGQNSLRRSQRNNGFQEFQYSGGKQASGKKKSVANFAQSSQNYNMGEKYVYSNYPLNMQSKIFQQTNEVKKTNQKQNSFQQKSETKQNKQIYQLITQILKNQKNLQKEVSLLRSQWGKQHQTRKIQTTNRNQVISFQQQQLSGDQHEAVEIVNRKASKQVHIKEAPESNEERPKQKPNISTRLKAQNKTKRYQNDVLSFAADPAKQNDTEQFFQDKKYQKEKPKCPQQKKPSRKQAHRRLYDLVANQRNKNERGDRVIVNQQCKSVFWKTVEQRMMASQAYYQGQSEGKQNNSHKNNKHEHEFYINTNELQKKLREDVIGKVYSQSNNCIFK